jgi:hypothetical protein
MSQIRKSTTSIKGNARKSLEITRDEYALCSYAHYRCADPRMKAGGWCTDTKDEVVIDCERGAVTLFQNGFKAAVYER